MPIYRVEYYGWLDDMEWEEELSSHTYTAEDMLRGKDMHALEHSLHGTVSRIYEVINGTEEEVYPQEKINR